MKTGGAAHVLTLGLAFGCAGLTGCRNGDLGPLPNGMTPRELNLLVVTLDTTRADRLGCYGYRDIRTPTLDALAAGGAMFEQAYATAPLTLPSHSSLFTGKYPPSHGVRDNGGYFLAQTESTLAETLRAQGYSTGGFVSAYVLDHRWGIAQGFDRYFDDFDLLKFKTVSMGDIQRRGDATLEQTVDWIRQQAGRKFFAWLHLYDPHSPYEPPEPYLTAYAGRAYVGEIAYADSLVGQLISELSRTGRLGQTLVVVVGDHGESLGEHNESSHAFFVYDATMHVPLILSGPWPGLAGRRIPDVVSLVDIMPTVLDLLGIEPPAGMQGQSLRPLLEGRSLPHPTTAYSESFYSRYHFGWSDLRSLRTGKYRFIEAPRPELYDTTRDPGELENLAGAHPDVLASMRAELAQLGERMGEPPVDTGPAEMDEETLKRLAALGYVGSTVDTTGKSSADLPDPKDKIGIVNRMEKAREQFLSGKTAESIIALKQIVADAPEVIDAWFRLGNAYLKAGQLDAALETFRKTLELKPDHDWAVAAMADTFVEMGRVDDALVGYRRFLSRDPDNDGVTYRMAETLLDANNLSEAARAFRRVLEINPHRASAEVGLAAVAARAGDLSGTRAAIARALAIDPNVRNAHYNLALALEAAGDLKRAEAEYRLEIEHHEHAFKSRFNLARLLRTTGDRSGQVRELQAVVSENPDFIMGRFYLAKALLDSGDLPQAEAEAVRALKEDPDHYYAPLGHYVLADIYAATGRVSLADKEVRLGRQLENRKLAPPPS